MPQIIYHRLWCKVCGDWERFKPDFSAIGEPEKTTICVVCKTPHEKTLISDIPSEKVKAQRERYKKQKSQEMGVITSMMAGGLGAGLDTGRIIESDAGWEAIAKARVERERAERVRQKEEVSKYRHVSRNDKCICGSGLKYKKCCYNKISSYR